MGPVQSIIHAREQAAAKKAALEAIAKTEKPITKELMPLQETTEQDMLPAEVPQRMTEKEIEGMSRAEKLARIEELLPFSNNEDLNQDVWNFNHDQISNAISKFVQTYGIMPSANRISKETGLNRGTVTKHLKEYREHGQHKERMEHFRFMESDVMTKVLAQAVQGDLKAAKLYFEMLHREDTSSAEKSKQRSVNQQNNYIQINGIVISQEAVEHINPEHLKQIETILRTSLPEPVSVS